ncbi:MAG TPA: alpha/beta hydrolase [Ktedonobacteraceae bacterium]|nr:alpha/beta hydrolase [Ktedonobacteraceae bacterium]
MLQQPSMQGASNPLVFIHGSGDSARIWRLQVDYFGLQHALAIDLPGHGQRADTLPQEASVQDYARAAHAIIFDELRVERPMIAGHSLGGAIALAMGLDYGDELGGLILIGTGARLRVLPDLLEATRTAPDAATKQLKALSFTPRHATTMVDDVLQEQTRPASYILHRDLAACNVFDCMARLQEIHLPTLIICGAEDRLTPIKYSQYLHEHIAGSTLRLIADAGHYVMREQPGAVNQAIEEWLKRD